MKFAVIWGNMFYALSGVFVAVMAMAAAYRGLDKITPFKTGEELQKGNLAVGIVVGGMFIAIGIAVGLTIAQALN